MKRANKSKGVHVRDAQAGVKQISQFRADMPDDLKVSDDASVYACFVSPFFFAPQAFPNDGDAHLCRKSAGVQYVSSMRNSRCHRQNADANAGAHGGGDGSSTTGRDGSSTTGRGAVGGRCL